MCQCFSVGNLYGSWLGLTILVKGGMSQLVSDPYEYNKLPMDIFSKTYNEDTLQCLYKDCSSLHKWQANRDLLSAISFLVMHHHQGKKLSILSPGDVNPRPIPSIRGCLRTVAIV
jgi:hypothetical protein